MAKRRTGAHMVAIAGVVVFLIVVLIVVTCRERLSFFCHFEYLGVNSNARAEYRHRQTGISFVLIPGGQFLMGSPQSENERMRQEGPVHEVRLDPFLMAKCEVSQEEWLRVMGSNPSEFQGAGFPVENVSWLDCREFCRRTGLSLPTEAQWEYACRAGTTTAYSFGDSITTDQANFDGHEPSNKQASGKKRGRTVAVSSFAPNAWGLYNMHGNVWEWCEDVFETDFYSTPEAVEANPRCNSGPGRRVMRGGAWFSGAWVCRSAARLGGEPQEAGDIAGFRPAARFP